VLSGRGLCDGLITRPEESYRNWRVVVCDHETFENEEAKARYRAVKIQPQWVVTPGKQTTTNILYYIILYYIILYRATYFATASFSLWFLVVVYMLCIDMSANLRNFHRCIITVSTTLFVYWVVQYNMFRLKIKP